MLNYIDFLRIRYSMGVNSVLSLLSNLPIIGNLIPADVFKYRLPKILVSFFGVIAMLLGGFIGTSLSIYFTTFIIPSAICTRVHDASPHLALYALLYIITQCLVPIIRQSPLFIATKEDQLYVNHFMVKPDTWYRIKLVKLLVEGGLFAIPVLYYIFRDLKIVATLILLRTAFMTLGTIIYAVIYEKTQSRGLENVRPKVAGVISLASYVVLFFWQIPVEFPSDIVIYGIAAASLIITLVCTIYLLNYKGYKDIANEYAGMSNSMVKVSSIDAETANRMRITEKTPEEHQQEFESRKYLNPWAYFDSMLHLRFAKAFRNFTSNSLVGLIFMTIAAGLIVRNGVFGIERTDLLQYSSFAVTFALGMGYAPFYVELCFRNMDSLLFGHGIYTKKTIRYSLVKRLGHILLRTLIHWIIFLLCFGAMLFIAEASIPRTDFFLLALVFGLAIFISDLTQLITYYLIQPYMRDSTVSSPLYSVVTYVQGIITFGILFVRGNVVNMLPYIAAYAGFLVLLLGITYIVSPRTFKMREV